MRRRDAGRVGCLRARVLKIAVIGHVIVPVLGGFLEDLIENDDLRAILSAVGVDALQPRGLVGRDQG